MQPSNDNAVFQVGKRYFCRSICDYECIWTFEVIGRTDKSVRIREVIANGTPRTFTRKIRAWSGAETCFPLGTYSMAPTLSAERLAA